MVEIKRAYVDTSIGQMHYRYAGEGDSLVLLHLTASSSEVYEPLMGLLASKYSVVAMDTPGFGMSDAPPRPFAIPDYAAVLQEALDGIGIATTSVFGHLTGASIASEFAASAPHRVEKLMLMRPVCLEAEALKHRLDQIVGGSIPTMELNEDGSYLKGVWDDLIGRQAGQRLDHETRHREMIWRLKAGPRFFEAPMAVFTFDMPGRLPLVQASTLVLTGENDSNQSGAKLATSIIKQAQLQLVPGDGHWTEIEHYKEMARIITEFLS